VRARASSASVSSRHLSQFNVVENPTAYEELDADDRELFDLAQRDPDAAAEADADWVKALWENPEAWLESVTFPEPDRRELADPARRRSFLEAVRESVRRGPEAFAWKQIDVFLPWGFRLADIAIEVRVFYGEQDAWVQRRHIDFLVETLPQARLTGWPDSGHGPTRHWAEILEVVTAR
jgi:pimeloyl-ACP methyl ester carboxylesterase